MGLRTAAVLAGLIAAAPAQAAVTASQLTTPADVTQRFFDLSAGRGPYGIQVAGTATTNGGGTNRVDIRCYANGAVGPVLGTFVVDAATKAFSGYVEPGQLTRPCVLRAVNNQANPPADPTPFVGARYYPSVLSDFRVTALDSPNAGTLYDVFDRWTAPDRTTHVTFGALGGCGLYAARPLDPGGDPSQAALDVFTCAGFLDDRADGDPQTRSGLLVDGRNAFAAGMLQYTDGRLSGVPGQPALEATRTTDPAGGYRLDESSTVVRCSAELTPYPPADATAGQACGPLADTGVAYQRRSETYADNRLVTVTDTWRSTDGQPHTIDLLLEVDLPSSYGLQLPWLGPEFAAHAGTEVPPGPPSAPATFFVRSDPSRSDSVTAPVGAVVMSSAPQNLDFYDAKTGGSSPYLQLHYVRTIPRDDRVTIQHSYVIGTALETVRARAAQVEDGLTAPRIAFTAPAPGATVTTPQLVLRGTASDVGGIRAVTVNGIPITLAADGTWSAAATLRPGPNTFTAAATDAAGNVGQAQLVVTYAPPRPACVVPSVVGLTRSGAGKRLAARGCKLGKVTTRYYPPRRVRKGRRTIVISYRRGTVVKQLVKPQRRLKPGASVRVTIQGRRPRR